MNSLAPYPAHTAPPLLACFFPGHAKAISLLQMNPWHQPRQKGAASKMILEAAFFWLVSEHFELWNFKE
jgi:hypothetical protein